MSLEVAPIISDIAGNVELVEDGKSGLVFPSKNSKALSESILKLYNNRELCVQMGKNAKKHIENNLNYKQTIQKTKAMFEDLMKGKP